MRDRVVLAAAVAHVLLVVAFLVAVAAGGELRLLLALVGGIVASIGWVAWLRAAVLTEVESSAPNVHAIRPAGRPLGDVTPRAV